MDRAVFWHGSFLQLSSYEEVKVSKKIKTALTSGTFLGLPRSAFDRDQIVGYSLRSRAIKRKTDRDQQAYSYTTRQHNGVLSIKCRCRCLADYKHSMGRAGRWGVSESVAAAARAVLR